jgi:flagellar FliJ protein
MSTLESLIRLHRWQLDEQRRRVADIEQLTTQLQAEMQRLDAEQTAEQQAAGQSQEASFAYGSYAGALIERRRKLAKSLAETEQQAVIAREALAEVFQEVKRYEIASAKRLLGQRVQADRLQQNNMDELGIEIHRRTFGIRNP